MSIQSTNENANDQIALKKTINEINKTMDAKLQALISEVQNLRTENINSLAEDIEEIKDLKTKILEHVISAMKKGQYSFDSRVNVCRTLRNVQP